MQLPQYTLSQAAADQVAADGVTRIVQGRDQDGKTQDHVMWRGPNGAVRSTLASEWDGSPTLAKLPRWKES